MRGLRLRGNYQVAVRAPNIARAVRCRLPPASPRWRPIRAELINTAGVITYGPALNANLRALCLQQGAPLATINTIANPTAAQANATAGGSIVLQPELADSWTVGMVFQPSFIPGLVDHDRLLPDHRSTEAIVRPSPGDLIAGCFGDNNGAGVTAASLNNPLCALFARNPVDRRPRRRSGHHPGPDLPDDEYRPGSDGRRGFRPQLSPRSRLRAAEPELQRQLDQSVRVRGDRSGLGRSGGSAGRRRRPAEFRHERMRRPLRSELRLAGFGGSELGAGLDPARMELERARHVQLRRYRSVGAVAAHLVASRPSSPSSMPPAAARDAHRRLHRGHGRSIPARSRLTTGSTWRRGSGSATISTSR